MDLTRGQGALRIVIAPDSFKGTIGAAEAARSLAEGWAAERPGDEIVRLPMADGGEGTLQAVAAAVAGARLHPIEVIGPGGAPVAAQWLQLPGGEAVVELACASGLLHLTDGLRPETAHSYGFGQALRAARESGALVIHAAIGGSASSDGGAGLLRALGAELREGGERGREECEKAGSGGAPLGLPEACRELELSRLCPPPSGGIRIWSDVVNPLLGPEGAVAVFGPQKGVTPELAPRLERRLSDFADAVERAVGRRLRHLPGAGAAGGAGFGLLAWGGVVESGSLAVAALVGLPEAVRSADVVIAGEGRYDAQTASGKAVSEVLRLVAERERPPALAAVVAGGVDPALAERGDGTRVLSLTELAGSVAAAMQDAERWLREAGALLARSWNERAGSR